MAHAKATTLILVTNTVAARQWREELLRRTDLNEDDIGEYSGAKKEISEHLMLLDLGRNDVGKVSKIGSVKVNQKFKIEKYSHVMHIVSNVVGDFDNKNMCVSPSRRTHRNIPRPELLF